MKFLFLDIDGVLNSECFFCLSASGDRSHNFDEIPSLDSFCKDFIDREAVEKVMKICSETGAEIVLSSSWRSDDKCFERLRPTGLVIERKTPSLFWKYQTYLCRGHEIEEYLKKNPSEGYCILDDDSDMLESQKDHFVHIDECFGLTDEDADRAIDILGRKS